MHQRDEAWAELYAHFPDYLGARNIFDVAVESVQTSCGFAVPYMEFTGERPTAKRWAEQQGEDGLQQYWAEKNQVSIDGFPTGLFAD